MPTEFYIHRRMHLTFFSCFGLSLCMFVTAYGSSFVEVKQTVTDDTIQGDFADEGNCNVRCINITQSG